MIVRKQNRKAIKTRKRVKFHRDIQRSLKQQNEDIRRCLLDLIDGSQQQNINSDRKRSESSSTELIRRWAIEHNITKRALTDLLKILKLIGISELPKDSRTLLATPKTVDLLDLAGGKMWYNGIARNLRLIFSQLTNSVVVQLNFNVDGLPIFKGSSIQFWPILAHIHGLLTILLNIH